MRSLVFRERVRFALVLTSVGALLLSAQSADAQFKPVPGHEYREFYNPVHPVAGEAVVGLTLGPTEAAQHATVVQVFLPRPFSGNLQVETMTANASFFGSGVFSGSTTGGKWVSLQLAPSGAVDARKSPTRPLRPAVLAIAVRGPARELYLARWGNSPTGDPTEWVRLYVNSGRAEMFVQRGDRFISCEPIGISQPVRFDRYCDLLLSDVPKDGQIKLIRRRQFVETPQTITVSVP